MAAGAAVSREGLFRTIREHWQATEDAIAAAGQRFDRPAHDAWTVGDIFRHITAANHEIASRIRTLNRHRRAALRRCDAGNTAGVEKFRALDSRMLRIELNTAHGVVWMYIQRFSGRGPGEDVPGDGQAGGAGRHTPSPRAARGCACRRGARGGGHPRVCGRAGRDSPPLGLRGSGELPASRHRERRRQLVGTDRRGVGMARCGRPAAAGGGRR